MGYFKFLYYLLCFLVYLGSACSPKSVSSSANAPQESANACAQQGATTTDVCSIQSTGGTAVGNQSATPDNSQANTSQGDGSQSEGTTNGSPDNSGGASETTQQGGASPGTTPGASASAPSASTLTGAIPADSRFTSYFLTSPLNASGSNYLTTADSAKNAVASMFHCPGDGFLVGEKSVYSDSDRVWAEYCQYFTDSNGGRMRKGSCHSFNNVNLDTKDLDFQCDTGVLAGHGTYFQSGSRDRLHSFECCDMVAADGNKATFIAEPAAGSQTQSPCDPDYPFIPDNSDPNPQDFKANAISRKQVNQLHGVLDLQCGAGAVIKHIAGYFSQGPDNPDVSPTPDRIYGYRCCKLEIQAERPSSSGDSGASSGDSLLQSLGQ